MRRLLKLVTTLLTGGLLLSALGLVTLLVVVPRLSGATSLSVLTGSMEPTIPTGSVVLIRPTDPRRIRAGDVITYQAAPGVRELVTHRVVRVDAGSTPPSFITKGDNNRGNDLNPVAFDAVRGEVWFHVPHVGSLATVMGQPAAWVAMGGAMGCLMLTRWLLGSRGRPSAAPLSRPAGHDNARVASL